MKKKPVVKKVEKKPVVKKVEKKPVVKKVEKKPVVKKVEKKPVVKKEEKTPDSKKVKLVEIDEKKLDLFVKGQEKKKKAVQVYKKAENERSFRRK